jgi:hypothetical protein
MISAMTLALRVELVRIAFWPVMVATIGSVAVAAALAAKIVLQPRE